MSFSNIGAQRRTGRSFLSLSKDRWLADAGDWRHHSLPHLPSLPSSSAPDTRCTCSVPVLWTPHYTYALQEQVFCTAVVEVPTPRPLGVMQCVTLRKTHSWWNRWRKIQRKEMRTSRKTGGGISQEAGDSLLSADTERHRSKKSRKGLCTRTAHWREGCCSQEPGRPCRARRGKLPTGNHPYSWSVTAPESPLWVKAKHSLICNKKGNRHDKTLEVINIDLFLRLTFPFFMWVLRWPHKCVVSYVTNILPLIWKSFWN